MDENLLQVREYNEEGYRPLVDFNGWRVAILNYIDELHPRNNLRMERHCQTDEVFVLLRGRATLIIGGAEPHTLEFLPQPMESGKLYNVRQNVWHAVLMSRDASILLVENTDTGESNSEYAKMSQSILQKMQNLAKDEGFDG